LWPNCQLTVVMVRDREYKTRTGKDTNYFRDAIVNRLDRSWSRVSRAHRIAKSRSFAGESWRHKIDYIG